jgi:hypothetical protein
MRHNRGMIFFLLLLALSFAALPATDKPSADKPAPRYVQRWFYLQTNLLEDKNVEDGISLVDRAGKAGYNGVVLADYKFNILERMPPNYFKNIARFQEAAKAAGIEIIPTVFPIGYSDGLLTHDPNLAEGLSVQNIPFVVKDGIAVLVLKSETKLANADQEDVQGDRFAGFSLQDDPDKVTFAARETVHNGKVSCGAVLPAASNTSPGHGGSGRVAAWPPDVTATPRGPVATPRHSSAVTPRVPPAACVSPTPPAPALLR